MSRYRIDWLDKNNENVLYIDQIPLHDYLYYLTNRRFFSEELVISYTCKIYGIDISEIIKDYPYYIYKENIYQKFKENHIETLVNDGTRKYFNNKGRKIYQNFIHQYFENGFEYDVLFPLMNRSIVHHIHPLVFSKNNDIENLIHISDFNHKLLHKNPFEQDEILCHKAVDYLGYLYTPNKINELIDKHKLINYKEDMKLAVKMLRACVENEMDKFYESLM